MAELSAPAAAGSQGWGPSGCRKGDQVQAMHAAEDQRKRLRGCRADPMPPDYGLLYAAPLAPAAAPAPAAAGGAPPGRPPVVARAVGGAWANQVPHAPKAAGGDSFVVRTRGSRATWRPCRSPSAPRLVRASTASSCSPLAQCGVRGRSPLRAWLAAGLCAGGHVWAILSERSGQEAAVARGPAAPAPAGGLWRPQEASAAVQRPAGLLAAGPAGAYAPAAADA
jgi:hypothetical protein